MTDWTYAYVRGSDVYHQFDCKAVESYDVSFEFTDDPEDIEERRLCGHCQSLMDGDFAETLELLSDDLDAMSSDPSIRPESDDRHDDGWMKFYLECPECKVPMARVLVESVDTGNREHDVTYHAVCPSCRSKASELTITRRTFDVG